jgi:hypothetical protein
MVYRFRRTRSLSSPHLDMQNDPSSEILLYVLPNEEKVEILTSDIDRTPSDFLCCFDSCDLNGISSAFWVFLGYESEEDGADAAQVIQTGLHRDNKSSLEGQHNGPPLLSSSSISSAGLDDMKNTKNISKSHSLSGFVRNLSYKLSKNRNNEARTEECSRSEDDMDEDPNPLPLSYMNELPAFSYTIEDDGEQGVGITPKSSARSARYQLAALDAATQRDFCALHELFFQCLLEEAKARRVNTKSYPNESMLNTDVLKGSKSFDHPLETQETHTMSHVPTDDNTFRSSEEIERQKSMLQIPYSLEVESPSFPLSSSKFLTRNNKFRRIFSVSSNGSMRDTKSFRASWYRLKRKGVSHRDDLIIAPTSDFHFHDETSYISEPSSCEGSSDCSHPKSEPVAPIFVHGNCRLQKDKYKGVKLGSLISAYGRDAVLRKLNEKIDLIAAIDLEDSRASLTLIAANRMPLASIRTSEMPEGSNIEEWNIDPDEAFQWEKKDVVETRSMIGIRMGLLSIQYGLLIQWDVRTCTADLIVLRKMCADDFIIKNNRSSRRIAESTVSSQEATLGEKVDQADVRNTVAPTNVVVTDNVSCDSNQEKKDPFTMSASISHERDKLSVATSVPLDQTLTSETERTRFP